jgi:hypothetical protein
MRIRPFTFDLQSDTFFPKPVTTMSLIRCSFGKAEFVSGICGSSGFFFLIRTLLEVELSANCNFFWNADTNRYDMTAISPWSPQPVAKATTLSSKPHHHLSEGTSMIGNYFARLTGSKRNLLALLASGAVFTAGCSNMVTTASSSNPLSSPATLSGVIHGGNQPVIGATVTLWFAGQGAPAIKAATTTTDSKGSFSFNRGTAGDGTTRNYVCPGTGGSPLVYVTSQGGNTQNNGAASQNNAAAAFIALYGDCSFIGASNFVYMSEVTTAATMAAVQQFFNPAADVNGHADTIIADSTGQQRLIMLNLPNTANLLANAATGLANSSLSIPAATNGSIASTVALTATPETAKINTLANIISACVNGATAADPNCATLFGAAAPPNPNLTSLNPVSFAPATDTLQALFYIFTNPTNGGSSNMTTLFGLQPAVGAPYQPSLPAKPTDWTIGVSYASSSTCGTATGGTGQFISSPTNIAVDFLDDVWFGNAQTGGNLSSISAAGAPFFCVNFDAGLGSSGGTIDDQGNAWSAGGTTMYRYNPITKATLAFPVGVAPLAITADGVHNVYFTAVAGTTGSLYELAGASTAAAAVTPTQISSTVGAAPLRLMPDFKNAATQGNIWVSSGSTFVSQVAPSTAVGNLNGFVTMRFTTSGNSYGVTASQSGIFVSSFNTGAIDQFVPSSGTYVSASGFPFTAASSAGISSPTGIALDGRLNTWIPNNGASSVSEISIFGGTGGAITPSTGYQKASTFLNSNKVLVVDQAGNVWIAGSGNSFITEIVGEGVPIYAPYALGLSNGRFQTIP